MKTEACRFVRIVAYKRKKKKGEKTCMDEKEVFFNGFCRCQNQGRIVLCVYVKAQGQWQIDEIDCGYLDCPHQDSCEIAKQVRDGITL